MESAEGVIRPVSTLSAGSAVAGFAEILSRRAAEFGDKRAFVFLDSRGTPEVEWTFAELDGRARRIAAALVEEGLTGCRVLLVFPQGLDFVAALYGCFYAGVIGVPVPFMPGRRTAERFAAIATDAGADGVLTAGGIRSDRAAVPEAMAEGGLTWIDVDALPAGGLARPVPAELAFLQYTSGSTGTPKGVAISHANLVANCGMIRDAFGDSEASCGVSWLPLFHDMGLVGHVLQPVYLGSTSVLMAPTTFFQRPLRWLKAISDWGATTSGAPTAGYDVCARLVRPQDVAGLDLSRWRLAYCGAEKVRPAVLERFAARFAEGGFSSGAFFPCYGLAEATLFVTGRHGLAVDAASAGAGAQGDAQGDASVALPAPSCGRPAPEARVVVADPEGGIALAEGQVGEVWVAGPHVARGYWGDAAGARSFHARLTDDEDLFLRTGDLGFLRGGELFLVGRHKDVLVVSGTNHAAEDVEDAVATSDPLFAGCAGAAFAVERGDREEPVVVQEIPSRAVGTAAAREAVERAMAAVVGRCGFRLGRMLLVRQGRLPRTSSGKIQRSRARTLYCDGQFEGLGDPPPSPPEDVSMNSASDRPDWRALFDPFSSELVGEPHLAYRRLRDAEPVHWSPPLKSWVITRMEDVRAVLEDPDFDALKTSVILQELGRRVGRHFVATTRFLDNLLFFISGEAHRQARRTAVKVMNRIPLSRLEPIVVELADGLMDRLPTEGRFDVVADFADPFPQMVMAHILDIPQADVPRLAALLPEVTRVFDAFDLKALDAIERGIAEATALMVTRIEAASDGSGLGMIRKGSDTVEDAAAQALILSRIGSETTVGMAGLAFRTLMDQPTVAARLRDDPSLIPLFVSEVLRLESSVQRSIRVGRVDKRIGGRHIAAGDRVMLMIGSANRDPARFEDPDTLRLERRGPDVAFGAGPHSCIGIALSHLEGRIAVERFLRHLPAVRAGEEEWYIGRTIRRLTRLPVQTQGAPR